MKNLDYTEKLKRLDLLFSNILPKEVFEINLKTYCSDIIICVSIGWLAFIVSGKVQLFSWSFFLCFIVATIALYRAMGFIHEICHQQKNKKFKSFVTLWHIFVGIPLLLPSSFYDCHLEHHNYKKYKTEYDPQYPALKGNRFAIIKLVLLDPLLFPLNLIIRLLILSPLSILSPPLRSFLYCKFSSIAKRDFVAHFNNKQKELLAKVEINILIFWSIVILLIVFKIIPLIYLAIWYFLVAAIWSLTFFRSLGEHSHDNLIETSLTVEEYLLDSFTYSRGGWQKFMYFPMYIPGIRYHALHHLCPAIPYHNLPKAHQFLRENLPEDNLYLQTERLGHWHNIKNLWNKA